jgi:hypothetical protein
MSITESELSKRYAETVATQRVGKLGRGLRNRRGERKWEGSDDACSAASLQWWPRARCSVEIVRSMKARRGSLQTPD